MNSLWDLEPGARGRPLTGIRVLDVSRVLAGPYCAMLLADLGATVVKVESPRGDETRRWGPPFDQGTATYFYTANRNKRTVVLDLGSPSGQEQLRSLLRDADVLVHNFTDQVMHKFHLSRAEVTEINPSCIHCTISGFGREQPDRRGCDLVSQALGGLMAVTGLPDGPPTKVGIPISDLAAGLYSALAVTAAIRDRDGRGHAAQVEVSLLDCVVALLSNQAMSWLAGGVAPHRLGNDHPQVAPYGLYGTGRGDIVIAAGTDGQFAALVAELGAPELAWDPRFASNAARVEHRPELRHALESLLEPASAQEWQPRLERAGIPSGTVRSVAEVFEDVGSRLVRSVEDVPQVLSPFRLDGKYMTPYLPPPPLPAPQPRLDSSDRPDGSATGG